MVMQGPISSLELASSASERKPLGCIMPGSTIDGNHIRCRHNRFRAMRVASPSELFATQSSLSSHGSPRVSSLLASTPRDSLPILEDSSLDLSPRSIPPSLGRQRLRTIHIFMSLLVSTVGPGMLSLPLTFTVLPTADAIVLMLVVGASSTLTALALLQAHVAVAKREEFARGVGAGRDFASYRSMATKTGGEGFGIFVSVVIVLGILGGCVGAIQIMKHAMPHLSCLLYELLVGLSYDSLTHASKATMETLLLWSIFIFVALPMCCSKTLSKLRSLNYVAFVLSVVFVAAVVYRGSTKVVTEAKIRSLISRPYDGDPSDAIDKLQSDQVSSIVPRVFQAVAIYGYAFAMQLHVLPLFVQLRSNFDTPINNSVCQMDFCVGGAIGLCSVLFILLGVFGARLHGSEMHGNILVNLEADPFMKLPLVAIYFAVLLSFPPLFIPGRIAIEELASRKPAADSSWTFRIIAAAAFLSSQLLVAMWVSGFEAVYTLVGATSTMLTSFVFPATMFTGLFLLTSQGWKGLFRCVVLWAIAAFVAISGLRTAIFLLTKT